MKTVIEINSRKITVSNKTAANEQLMFVLKRAYNERRFLRLRIWYGDVITGRAWPEENDVTGYISCSTGHPGIFILLNSRSSRGGGAILDECIVRIDSTAGNTLYKHSNFHTDLKLSQDKKEILKIEDDSIVARFDNELACKRLYQFLEGKRYKK